MRKTRRRIRAALTALLSIAITGPVLADPPSIPGHFFEYSPTPQEVAAKCSGVHALAWTGEDGDVQYLGVVDPDLCRERLARKDAKVRGLIRKNWNDRYDYCVKSRTKNHGDRQDVAEKNCAALSLLSDGRPHSASLPIERFMCGADVMTRAPDATAGVCVKNPAAPEIFPEVAWVAHDAMVAGIWKSGPSCVSHAPGKNRFVTRMLEMIDERRGLDVAESLTDGRVRTLLDLGFRCSGSSSDGTPQNDAEIRCEAEWISVPWHQTPVLSEVIWRSDLRLEFSPNDVCAHAESGPFWAH